MKQVLLLNSISGLALYAVSIVTAFLLSPVLVVQLGNRDYGVWEILLSLCGYMGILDLGVSPAVVRFIAREAAIGTREGLNRIFNSSFFCLGGIGGFVLLVLAILSRFPHAILGGETTGNGGLQTLFLIVGCNLWLEFTGTPLSAYVMGLQEHFFVNSLRIVLTLAQAILTYFALTSWGGPGLLWVAGILLAGNFVRYGALALWVFARTKDLKIRPRYVSFATLKELYLFGLKSCLLMVSDRVQRQSAPIVIGHVLGLSQVVFFAIPNRLVGYAKELGLAVGYPLMPYFSSLDARSNSAATREAWISLSRCLQFVVLPLPVLVFFLGEGFIHRWMGPDYAEQARWVIRFLAFSLLMEGLAPNAGRFLVGGGRHGRPAIILLGISALGLGPTILFARQWDVSGVALSLAILNGLSCLTMWSFAARASGVALGEHVQKTLLPVLFPLVAMAATLPVSCYLLGNLTYMALVINAGLAGTVYLGTLWGLAMNAEERNAVVGLLKGLAVGRDARIRAGI